MKKIYASILSLVMGASIASFAAEIPANAKCYDGSTPGSLTVEMFGSDILYGQGTGKVYIIPVSDGVVDFLLPDLTIALDPGADPVNLGDIRVDNVTTTTAPDGTVTYNATVEDMSLAEGGIHAQVILANGEGKSCTTTSNGVAHFDIDVNWYTDYENDKTQVFPLYVAFNGHLMASSIADLAADEAAEATYFDLQGNRVNADALINGQTYIKRVGTTATKVIINK